MNDLWDIVFIQEASFEGLRSYRVTVPVKQDVQNEAMLGYCQDSGQASSWTLSWQ